MTRLDPLIGVKYSEAYLRDRCWIGNPESQYRSKYNKADQHNRKSAVHRLWFIEPIGSSNYLDRERERERPIFTAAFMNNSLRISGICQFVTDFSDILRKLLGNRNAFRVEPTVLETEGGRTRNADSERFWRVESAAATNGLGRPTAYRLHSSGMLRPWFHAGTTMEKRAAFIFNHVWCTPYDAAERYPAGRFVNQSDGSETIATWVRQGRSIRDTDIVLWHSFGLLHLPRLEDWPVQPVARTGFRLEADGFFDRNPTLDVPPGA